MADGTYVNEPLPGGGSQVTEIDTVEVDFNAGDIRKRQRIVLSGNSPTSPDVFTRTGAASSSDGGLVVHVATTPAANSNVRTGGSDVSSTNRLPVQSVIVGPDGVNAVSTSNRLPVDIGGATVQATFSSHDATENETQTPLAANATFTGTWYDVLNYAAISATIQSDVPSATNGLIAEFSHNGTDVITSIPSTYPGGNFGAFFSFPVLAQYFRVRYVNGPAAQTYVRSHVAYEFTAPGGPQQALAGQLTDTSLGGVVRSAVTGRMSTGAWKSLAATAAGELQTVINGPVTIQKTNGLAQGTLVASAASGASQTYAPVSGPTGTAVIMAVPAGHSSSFVEITGTFSPGSQVVFEQSDDTTGTGGFPADNTWAATNMRRNNTPDVNENYSQIENNPYGTSNTQIWKGTVGGAAFFRVRCNQFVSGDSIQVRIVTSEGVGGTFLLGNPPSVSDYYQAGMLAAVGDTVECKSGGMGSFAALFSGTWTGKIQIEQTIDGTTWRPTNVLQAGGVTGTYISGTGVTGQTLGARGTAGGTKAIRLRADSDFVGSLNGTLRTGAGSSGVFLTSPIQVGGLASGSQTIRQSVGVTAVRIDPSALATRTSVEVKYHANGATNNAYVYVGFSSGVTTATGRELSPGETWTLDVTTATQLWAISTTAGQPVQVTEIG